MRGPRPSRSLRPVKVPKFRPRPLRADVRESGTLERSRIVTVPGGAGAPPAVADLVGAAVVGMLPETPVKRCLRHPGHSHEFPEFPSLFRRGAQRPPENVLG